MFAMRIMRVKRRLDLKICCKFGLTPTQYSHSKCIIHYASNQCKRPAIQRHPVSRAARIKSVAVPPLTHRPNGRGDRNGEIRRMDPLQEEREMSIRWDAVVKNNTFRSSRQGPAATAAAPDAPRAGAPVEIQVWLFGMLAGSKATNPLVLQFAGGCALRDVIDELGRRLGPDFLRTVVSESGETFNTCRVFLDGELAKDLATPVAGGAAATVEIILLSEIEGG